MNNFQFTGYVRNPPEIVKTTQGNLYCAVVLTRDKGSINVPVYFKGPLAKKVIKEVRVGALINVEGSLRSENIIDGYFIGLRLFCVATALEIVNSAGLTFKRNVVFNKLLALEDTEDLFKTKTKGNKSNGK